MPRNPSRRQILALVAVLSLSSALAVPAAAQTAGSQSPIRILVGFPAGGGTDAIARTLAEKLKDQLGQPVVVDNRAGAGGQIAAQALKAAAPDGQTLFLSHDHTISILPLVTKNPGFDPAQDFVAVAGLRDLRQRARAVGRHAGQERCPTTSSGCAPARAARATWACRRRPRCRSSW